MPTEASETVMAMTDACAEGGQALFCVGYNEAPQTGQCMASRV